MNNHRTIFIFAVLLSVFFSITAIASEKFVLSALDRDTLILKIYKLDGGHLITMKSKVIRIPDTFLFNTAVTFRKENGTKFDVYYAFCIDTECVNMTLGLQRVDSKLNSEFAKDDIIPSENGLYFTGIATERVEKDAGPSLRLLLGDNREIVEQSLDAAGNPVDSEVVLKGVYQHFTASEDGKMVVASKDNLIQIRPLNPGGDERLIQVGRVPESLTLSGPVFPETQSTSAGSVSKPFRYLLYRVFKRDLVNPASRILMQKIDGSTGEFLGPPQGFTKYKSIRYLYGPENYKSIAITPKADVVFYQQFDPACNSEVLKAQVMNPQKGTKIGKAQLLIGCNELSYNIRGIDVAQFQQ